MRATLQDRVTRELEAEKSITAQEVARRLHIKRVGTVRTALVALFDAGLINATPGMVYFSLRG